MAGLCTLVTSVIALVEVPLWGIPDFSLIGPLVPTRDRRVRTCARTRRGIEHICFFLRIGSGSCTNTTKGQGQGQPSIGGNRTLLRRSHISQEARRGVRCWGCGRFDASWRQHDLLHLAGLRTRSL
jgi:hypothetical protein